MISLVFFLHCILVNVCRDALALGVLCSTPWVVITGFPGTCVPCRLH